MSLVQLREKEPGEIRALARENFRRIGENFLCAARTATFGPDRTRSFMDVVEIRPSKTGTELKLIKHVHGPTAGGKEASQ